MAETNRLDTIIQLRYGTYSQWMNSSIILKLGEAAICAFPYDRTIEQLSNSTPNYTPPAIGIKIGDGSSYFYQLPWVQAVAADVYTWAKSSTKPSYTASEISGLSSFIEENFHISGNVTISPRIYQIIQGTGNDAHKYYLRYKESNEEAEWVVDTNHPIDLTTYNDIYDWIGQSAIDNYMTLGDLIGYLITRRLNNLDYSDNTVSHKFVTSVSEENGIIEVTRDQPNFSDISGIAGVSQGGTGTNTFPDGQVLVGNGTGAITTVPIAESIGNNDYLVTNRLVKNFVETATAGLTGAMHFIGEATVNIRHGSSVNPNIENYNFANALPGDVILYDYKEFVWDGAQWILLGDERSYAIKGSITNGDIAEEAEISQSKISGLTATFNTKVDKVDGKTLSSNDFTDELAQKLDEIENNAQVNIIEHILVNGVETRPTVIDGTPKSVNLQISEFDSNAQNKLSGIENNAEVNTIESIIYNNEPLVPDANRTITITENPHTEHENKIEQIFINDREWEPNQQKQVRITIDQAALNLNVVEGAIVPNIQGGTTEVPQTSKKLELERIAMTGDVKDLLQENDEYITLYCGSSTDVI